MTSLSAYYSCEGINILKTHVEICTWYKSSANVSNVYIILVPNVLVSGSCCTALYGFYIILPFIIMGRKAFNILV